MSKTMVVLENIKHSLAKQYLLCQFQFLISQVFFLKNALGGLVAQLVDFQTYFPEWESKKSLGFLIHLYYNPNKDRRISINVFQYISIHKVSYWYESGKLIKTLEF